MGTPHSISDLASHRIAAHALVDVRPEFWCINGRKMDEPFHIANPKWLINDSSALTRFALSDAGITVLSTIEGNRLVDDGLLVRVLPEFEQMGATASLIWPESRYLSPRVRAFIDHAADWFQRNASTPSFRPINPRSTP